MNTHRIAVISDTHGLLRPECIRVLETCEVIMHAGDVGKPEILSRLREIAETYVVRGNVDKEWAEDLPVELETELCGFHFYMVHNKKYIRANLGDADIVIYGHSHKYEEKRQGNITYLNPGSCGARRFRLPVTMMVLTVFPQERRFKIEKIDCLPEHAEEEAVSAFPQKEMDRLIGRIIKEIEAGKGIAEIADKVRVDRVLVEQICRTKLINHLMIDGKKAKASSILYDSFDIIKDKTGKDPVEVFEEAMNNVMPVLEVKARRIGGSNYQIPVEVRPERRTTLGLRWIVSYARLRNEHTMDERLANEIMDAANNTGSAVKRREDVHKMAEANRAFAHYRF